MQLDYDLVDVDLEWTISVDYSDSYVKSIRKWVKRIFFNIRINMKVHCTNENDP